MYINQLIFTNMKKLVCIAVFSFAIAANATEKNEIVNSSDEKEVLTKSSTGINDIDKEISEDEIFFDCGNDGDIAYAEARLLGMSHREARSERRDFVRACRGGTWAWLGFCAGLIGHCD